jgi:hypothetical protein
MIPTLARRAALATCLVVPIAVAVAAATPSPAALEADLSMTGSDLTLTEAYCDLRGVVDETLRHDFAEEPQLAALTGTGMTMELWASDLLGTWTMVHHGADGISCIVTSGQDWSTDVDAVNLLDTVLQTEVHQS